MPGALRSQVRASGRRARQPRGAAWPSRADSCETHSCASLPDASASARELNTLIEVTAPSSPGLSSSYDTNPGAPAALLLG